MYLAHLGRHIRILERRRAETIGPSPFRARIDAELNLDRLSFQAGGGGLGAAAAVERAAGVEELDRGRARPAFAAQHDVLMDLLRSGLNRRRPVGAEQDQGIRVHMERVVTGAPPDAVAGAALTGLKGRIVRVLGFRAVIRKAEKRIEVWGQGVAG